MPVFHGIIITYGDVWRGLCPNARRQVVGSGIMKKHKDIAKTRSGKKELDLTGCWVTIWKRRKSKAGNIGTPIDAYTTTRLSTPAIRS
jgi:hypothetical protein